MAVTLPCCTCHAATVEKRMVKCYNPAQVNVYVLYLLASPGHLRLAVEIECEWKPAASLTLIQGKVAVWRKKDLPSALLNPNGVDPPRRYVCHSNYVPDYSYYRANSCIKPC